MDNNTVTVNIVVIPTCKYQASLKIYATTVFSLKSVLANIYHVLSVKADNVITHIPSHIL